MKEYLHFSMYVAETGKRRWGYIDRNKAAGLQRDNHATLVEQLYSIQVIQARLISDPYFCNLNFGRFHLCTFFYWVNTQWIKSQAKLQATNQVENEYHETAEPLHKELLSSNIWVIFPNYLLKNQNLYIHYSKCRRKTP